MKLLTTIVRVGLATEAVSLEDPDGVITVARLIDTHAKRLFGRSLAIRQVDAGSCNGCELEIGGLTGPTYDLERFGLHFVASPRHADLLLVTGPVTRNMAVPLRKTWEATPAPRMVVAVGDCADDCGIFAGSYAIAGPVSSIIPVDATVRGCPPEPADILRAILASLDMAQDARTRRTAATGRRHP